MKYITNHMLILNCTKFDEYMYKFISLTLDNFCIF